MSSNPPRTPASLQPRRLQQPPSSDDQVEESCLAMRSPGRSLRLHRHEGRGLSGCACRQRCRRRLADRNPREGEAELGQAVVGLGDRVDAGDGLRGTGPAVPPCRLRFLVSERHDHLQPRRVLPDQPRRPQELPVVHAPSSRQPGGHRTPPRTYSTGLGARGVRGRPRRRGRPTVGSSPMEVHWISSSWGSAAMVTSGFNEPSNLTVAECLPAPDPPRRAHPRSRAPTPPANSTAWSTSSRRP